MEINSSTSSAAIATTTTAADNGSGKENDTISLSSLDPNELRQAANARFAASALDEALPLYTLAITTSRQRNDVPPTDLIVHLCNRSACLYRMEMYAEACEDATEAVMLCGENKNNGNTNCKAMFRLARAQIALNDYTSALVTIEKTLTFCNEQLKQQQQSPTADDDDNDDNSNNALTLQTKEFEKLKAIALRKQKQSPNHPNNNNSSPQQHGVIKSIKLEPLRTPSIKEFARTTKHSGDDTYNPLGEGNFSTVVICTHKVTHEKFALKIIEKEECKKLAKRQHPNVYNEVAMERRVLTQDDRLSDNVNIIRAYHTMQDYGNLYFLMELHQEHGDLWSQIRYKKCMVGCHSSLIRTYVYELLSALEHCHTNGIVHRDIKPENVLLSERGGHVVLIDFGTAKDLIRTDLNGPEFVGTPDFMSPEAVKECKTGGVGCDFTADLWALGVVIYQLYSGALPFESQSPYLGFLKIQRGSYARNMGVWDDDAWDLIQQLLKVKPSERLGSGCFEWIPPAQDEEPTVTDEKKSEEGEEDVFGVGVNNVAKKKRQPSKSLGKVIQGENGYDIIRQHPFFAKHISSIRNQSNCHLKSADLNDSVHQPIPSLQDLAIRATAHLIDQSSLDVDMEDTHPPGDNSSYDALRLKPSDRRRVMHLLDRFHLLKEPRIYRRFFHSKQDARLGRVRPESREVMGLTQMNDKMGQMRGVSEDQPHPDEQVPASKLVGDLATRIHHITNPLFCKSINERCSSNPDDETERKGYIKQLKESIRLVNRTRPTVVIACGYFDASCLKILSKVNETVPVILHDGTSFFNFWVYGAHCVAMPIKYFKWDGDDNGGSSSRNEALEWFRMELEQIKTARSFGCVFVDGDPREIPSEWIAKMGKRHVVGLLGLCNGTQDNVINEGSTLQFETKFVVAVHDAEKEPNGNVEDDEMGDDISVSSSDSDDDKSNGPEDEHVMHIVGRIENGVRCITLPEDDLIWDAEILL